MCQLFRMGWCNNSLQGCVCCIRGASHTWAQAVGNCHDQIPRGCFLRLGTIQVLSWPPWQMTSFSFTSTLLFQENTEVILQIVLRAWFSKSKEQFRLQEGYPFISPHPQWRESPRDRVSVLATLKDNTCAMLLPPEASNMNRERHQPDLLPRVKMSKFRHFQMDWIEYIIWELPGASTAYVTLYWNNN